MASNTQPIYPRKVVGAEVSIATADASRTAPVSVGTLYTSPAASPDHSGSIVQSITAVAAGTTTAGVVRIFRHNGTAYFLIRELLVSAITPGVATESFKLTTAQGADVNGRLSLNLLLEPGDSIRCTTNNAETFHVTADIGEY